MEIWQMKTRVDAFRTKTGEWCAEVYVQGEMLEVEYGPTKIDALGALWAKVTRAHNIQSAGLNAVYSEVFRVDPWREWRALWRRVSRPFRKPVAAQGEG